MLTHARGRAAGLLAVLALVSALLAAACGGDDAGGGDAAIINAITVLDTAGLHDIDEAINDQQTVPANARTVARKLQAVVLLTEWPDDLADDAEALAGTLGELAAALDADPVDMARAGQLAAKAHDDEHDFSHAVWEHLYGEAGIAGEADGHD